MLDYHPHPLPRRVPCQVGSASVTDVSISDCATVTAAVTFSTGGVDGANNLFASRLRVSSSDAPALVLAENARSVTLEDSEFWDNPALVAVALAKVTTAQVRGRRPLFLGVGNNRAGEESRRPGKCAARLHKARG